MKTFECTPVSCSYGVHHKRFEGLVKLENFNRTFKTLYKYTHGQVASLLCSIYYFIVVPILAIFYHTDYTFSCTNHLNNLLFKTDIHF